MTFETYYTLEQFLISERFRIHREYTLANNNLGQCQIKNNHLQRKKWRKSDNAAQEILFKNYQLQYRIYTNMLKELKEAYEKK